MNDRFVESFDDYSKYYDKIYTFDFDIPFYKRWAKISGGPVLELCCGTGRISLPIAKESIEITGVDLIEAMVSQAKNKADNQKLQANFVTGDMRTIRLEKKFNQVIIPFNSLQHIHKQSEIEAVFSTVKYHLKDDGYFIFNVLNPLFEGWARVRNIVREKLSFNLEDGSTCMLKESVHYDFSERWLLMRWYYTFDRAEKLVQNICLRMFYPEEIDELLKNNGFKIVHKFGTFQEGPFDGTTYDQIFVCSQKR